LLLCLIPFHGGPLAAQEGTIVFLVRHAERADDAPGDPAMAMDPRLAQDPPLSEAGQLRAALLARMLRDAGITHVHSTDYRRTRETAAPTAEAVHVELEIYDSSEPESFARTLRTTGGRHLVVGHSNTLPTLVEALGGDPGPPIESLEYDRLYVVTLGEGQVRTILLRYGEPSMAPAGVRR
jgi:probable phosphoglycerate mutase